MSQLLTLEGKRLRNGIGKNFPKNTVKPKTRRGLKMVAKPLTCAALSGSIERYEMNGLLSRVKKGVKSVAKKTVKAVKKAPSNAFKAAKVVGKTGLNVAKFSTVTVAKKAFKAGQLVSRGQYSSALKKVATIGVPQSALNKAVKVTKKTSTGKALARNIAKINKPLDRIVNKGTKKAVAVVVTAYTGNPAAGRAVSNMMPEVSTASNIAPIIESSAPETSYSPSIAPAIQEVPSETSSSSKTPWLIAGAGIVALFLLKGKK